ncbi:MAG: nuclear transport factor 2 family protein [Bryobacteraceae bacterium]|nr:nuclear transport factor 2 family protein [Bryobacteraceae bacterium]
MKHLLVVLSLAVSAAAADDRQSDREAIRAHLDRIFQGFIKKDAAELRATHHENWRGFLEGSRGVIKGIDGYMRASTPDPKSPYGMKAYNLREFDIVFYGDTAFVSFVADLDALSPSGPVKRALRITDLYVKEKGHWIQAGSHTVVHPETQLAQLATPGRLSDTGRKNLLEARESVWRSWFGNDQEKLKKLVPPETIAASAGGGFEKQAAILSSAVEAAKSGTKLVSLEFPSTEIQNYGPVAVLYSTYKYVTETGGKQSASSGTVMELFLYRDGQWVNPGWHMDATAKQ